MLRFVIRARVTGCSARYFDKKLGTMQGSLKLQNTITYYQLFDRSGGEHGLPYACQGTGVHGQRAASAHQRSPGRDCMGTFEAYAPRTVGGDAGRS